MYDIPIDYLVPSVRKLYDTVSTKKGMIRLEDPWCCSLHIVIVDELS